MSSLLVTHGPHFGVRYELLDTNTLGRASSCTVQLLDEKTSRVHSSISLRDGHYWIEDEGSSNGTGVNGSTVSGPTRLEPGDEISVGRHLMLFDPDMEILREVGGDGAVVMATGLEETVVDDGRGSPAEREENTLDLGTLLEALAEADRNGTSSRRLVAQLGTVGKSLGADRAALLATDGDGRSLRALATWPTDTKVTLDKGLIRRALKNRERGSTGDGVGTLTVRGGRALVEARLGSALAVPFGRGSETAGLVYLDSARSGYLSALPIKTLGAVFSLVFEAALPEGAAEETTRAGRELLAELGIVSTSQLMIEVGELAKRYAASHATVLLTGETGTGKEVLSQAIHNLSRRSRRPFVAVNCGALPEGLAESELFGHERGAFTGADRRKTGLFEEADGGTLMLDEIGDLPPLLQVKLLRTLQEGRFYRVGGTQPVACDVRVIAATHRDLTAMVREGTFRRDLYYRLDVLRLELPPLRDRKEDLGPLVAHFVKGFNERAGTLIQGFEPDALRVLGEHSWPGNVRELENLVERMLVLTADEEVTAVSVRQQLALVPEELGNTTEGALGLAEAVAQLEGELVEAAMRKARGNKSRAARILGVSRPTLDRKLVQYRIDIFRV